MSVTKERIVEKRKAADVIAAAAAAAIYTCLIETSLPLFLPEADGDCCCDLL